MRYSISTSLLWIITMLPQQEALGAEDQTQILIDQASALYGGLDYEKAIRILDAALQVQGNSREQLIRIYHILGLCFGSLGHVEKSQEAFAKLLALDADFKLSPDISPRIRKNFHDALKNTSGGLRVSLSPPSPAEPGKQLVITIQLLANPLQMAKELRVWFRQGNQEKFSSIQTKIEGLGSTTATIPPPSGEPDQANGPVFWYAVIEGDYQSQLQTFGDASHPLVLALGEPFPHEKSSRESFVKKSALDKAIELETPQDRKLVSTHDSSEPDEKDSVSWYQRWWVWALIGGAIAATATVVIVTTTSTPDERLDFWIDVSTASRTIK